MRFDDVIKVARARYRTRLLEHGVAVVVVDEVMACEPAQLAEFAEVLLRASPEEVAAVNRAAATAGRGQVIS